MAAYTFQTDPLVQQDIHTVYNISLFNEKDEICVLEKYITSTIRYWTIAEKYPGSFKRQNPNKIYVAH